jgi:hypothetical protein
MAEGGTYSEARTGNWLWTLLVGAILLVMELILFAALVPATWSERVRDTELAWLHQGLGPSTANAVIARAGALSPLAVLPLWSWVAGRLEVIWAAFYQALQRLAMLVAWWPFLLLLITASWADGWVRRRIRQAGFAYASPLAHAYALRGIVIIVMLLGLVLFLPVPLPVLGVPVVAALIGLLVGAAVANAQKRL